MSRQSLKCRDKISLPSADNMLRQSFEMSRQSFTTFSLVLCYDIVVKCCDKVQLTPSHNCRDINFQCHDILSLPFTVDLWMVCSDIRNLVVPFFLSSSLCFVASIITMS